MKRLVCLALLGLIGAGVAGCEMNVKTDTDTDHGTETKTTVKRETPSGETTYERKTETKTEVH